MPRAAHVSCNQRLQFSITEIAQYFLPQALTHVAMQRINRQSQRTSMNLPSASARCLVRTKIRHCPVSSWFSTSHNLSRLSASAIRVTCWVILSAVMPLWGAFTFRISEEFIAQLFDFGRHCRRKSIVWRSAGKFRDDFHRLARRNQDQACDRPHPAPDGLCRMDQRRRVHQINQPSGGSNNNINTRVSDRDLGS